MILCWGSVVVRTMIFGIIKLDLVSVTQGVIWNLVPSILLFRFVLFLRLWLEVVGLDCRSRNGLVIYGSYVNDLFVD